MNDPSRSFGKVLVTGGAGFIGSHLTARLRDCAQEVVVIDNELRGNKLTPAVLAGVQYLRADVRDHSLVAAESHGAEVIFHFAAVLGVDVVAAHPTNAMEVEAEAGLSVAAAARATGARVVFASTSAVYGAYSTSENVVEETPVSPVSSYAIAKRFVEGLLKAQYDELGLPAAILRLFNVYGLRQDERMVIPRFLQQARAGEPITVFGDGSQTRDFTYIDDVITAVLHCARLSGGCEIVNIGHEEEVPIQTLAEKIKSLTKSSSPVVNIEVPPARRDFEVNRRVGLSAKLRRLTGDSPRTSLDHGLQHLIDHP